MKLSEFFVELGVKANTVTLDLFKTKMSDLTVASVGELYTLGRLAIALKNFGEEGLKTAQKYSALSAVYGVNIQFLQKMERAGLAFNVTTQQTQASITGLQGNLAAMMLGQGSSGFQRSLGWFGVGWKPGETAEQMMPELEKAVPRFVKAHGALGAAMASNLLGQMGMAPEMIQELIKGPSAIRKAGQGATIADKTISAETNLANKLELLSRNSHILLTDGIAKLIGPVSKIADFLTNVESTLGGKTAKGTGEAYGIGAVAGAGIGGLIGNVPGALIGGAIGSMGLSYLYNKFPSSGNTTHNHNTTIHAHAMTADQIDRLKKRQDEKNARTHTKTMQTLNSQVAG